MFSVKQKRYIASEVQKILRNTGNPELPEKEIYFQLHVTGSTPMSWANIGNNSAHPVPTVNPHNEVMDKGEV